MLARCPHCSKALKIPQEHLDQVLACPTCRKSFVVPSPVVQTPPVIVPKPVRIPRHTLRKILAAICRWLARPWTAWVEIERKEVERIRKEAEQRQLVAAQREAERERKHQQWLTILHREMAFIPTVDAAMNAVRAFDKLTAMIGSLGQLGPAGFNEGEFNSTVWTMFTNLRHQSLETVPTLARSPCVYPERLYGRVEQDQGVPAVQRKARCSVHHCNGANYIGGDWQRNRFAM